MDIVGTQREIEFRAWDELKKVMHNDFQFIKSGDESNDWIVFTSDKQKLSDKPHPLENPYFQQQLKITQYTGLKDKHGNKIFEGDIVKAFPRSFTGEISEISEHNALCFWSVSSFNFRLLPISDNLGRCVDNYSHGFEIIGNVFDNPELLGEAND